jgi:signal transduction histidine kinase
MLPFPWRFSISVARTALGVNALAFYVFHAESHLAWPLLPLIIYVLYAICTVRLSMETDGAPLETLAIDLAAFLAWLPLTATAQNAPPSTLAPAGAFYVFLIATAVLTQHWTRALGVAGACLVEAFAIPQVSGGPLRPVMVWCAVLAGVWVVNRLFLESRLDRAARHSVMYRFEAQHAREDERQRIAADFHDGPLQSFIGLQMRLEILKKMLSRDPRLAAEELIQVQDLCKSQVGELRAFVRSMRPADVEGASLGASISRMVEQFQKDTGISASFLSGDYVDPAETEVSLELLQIVREALNNVQKHSRATRVAVALNRKDSALEIRIDDNGAGFPFSGSYTLEELDLLRLGPISIRRRVRALGGELNIESRPGQGVGMQVRVALA